MRKMTRESIENAIRDLYGIGSEKLYANNYGREPAIVSTVRYLYWLMLKRFFGMSVDSIAAEFHRTPRAVYKGVAQVGWGINNMKYYAEPYRKIIEAASE